MLEENREGKSGKKKKIMEEAEDWNMWKQQFIHNAVDFQRHICHKTRMV